MIWKGPIPVQRILLACHRAPESNTGIEGCSPKIFGQPETKVRLGQPSSKITSSQFTINISNACLHVLLYVVGSSYVPSTVPWSYFRVSWPLRPTGRFIKTRFSHKPLPPAGYSWLLVRPFGGMRLLPLLPRVMAPSQGRSNPLPQGALVPRCF